ncbi:hypothetical protein AKJ58_00180 [candidate division MSBL1 archaeon SCGC-AAA385D11]|uniref:Uncharacterized protein n=1 Tax=candidate division MSBL1 archaeon SCGC-AAA385D11 TaxID=1698286 RepID=A0A133VPJ1_9EURY|nr:hypothetical protein AKJ58_00180 [candidate division MSBL1 archaeon SCGC-AAA385D11]
MNVMNVIEKETAKVFLGKEVYVTKTDGYTWVGELIKVTDTSIILESKKHGKSVLSLNRVEEMGEAKNSNGGGGYG